LKKLPAPKYKNISNILMLTEKEYAEIIYMYVSIRGSRAACDQYHSLCDFFLIDKEPFWSILTMLDKCKKSLQTPKG
jgi:hypothetical protein